MICKGRGSPGACIRTVRYFSVHPPKYYYYLKPKSHSYSISINTLGLNGKGQLRTTNPNLLKVKVTAQSCRTLGNLMDGSLTDSSVHGISQARIMERVAIPFSRGPSQPRDQIWVSHIAGRFFTV